MISPENISLGLLESLGDFDTPTVCNAIEVVQGTRGFNAYTKKQVIRAGSTRPLVGFARTARIAAAQMPSESTHVIKERRLEYFRSMQAGPSPSLAVIEDTDYPNCTGAWWGEVHSAVHKGLGLQGALTNGLVRDLDDIEPGFTIIAGAVGPSHAFVHVIDLGEPVHVLGIDIRQNDLVHADQHGAVVIPPDVLPELAEGIKTLLASEQLILEPARAADFSIEKLEHAWKKFEQSRT